MNRLKYGNVKVKIDGIQFDSKKESRRYQELLLLQRAGEIGNLVVHPKYQMIPAITVSGKNKRARYYIADFEYTENGKTITEDVKGMITKLADWKMQQFQYQYPDIDLRIV